jgi:HD-GYP domain-containing protein (c-di-GMP phosphodiesterase class II)
MRRDRDELYQHSLKTAIIVDGVGVRAGLNEHRLQKLFLVSVSHDLCEMYTDPDILLGVHAIEGNER